jgi:hypothetical protein
MRSAITYLLIGFFAITLFSCKTNQETTIRKITRVFLVDLNNEDYINAKKLVTESGKGALEMLESIKKLGLDSIEHKSENDFETTGCTIRGDTATCYYSENGKERHVELVKVKGKWLIDFKKEQAFPTPAGNPQQEVADSLAAVDYNVEQYNDTATLFDLCLTDMQNNGNFTSVTFMLNNRSAYNIEHLWLKAYFSDTHGNFLQEDDLMFNNIPRKLTEGSDSNPYPDPASGRVNLMLERVNPNNIGEIFLYPMRTAMEEDFYNYYSVEPTSLKKIIKIRNSTPYRITVTF